MSDIDEMRTWNIEKLWNFISVERGLDHRVRDIVRFGKEIKMDIYDYMLNNFTTKSKAGKVVYRGRVYYMEDLYTDIEERRRIAFEWIERNYPDKRVVTPRKAPTEVN